MSQVKILKLKDKMNNSTGFRIPGGYTIPVLSAIFIIWFLLQLSTKEFIAVGIFFIALSIIYFVNKRFKKE